MPLWGDAHGYGGVASGDCLWQPLCVGAAVVAGQFAVGI